jgi:hypothetical protein
MIRFHNKVCDHLAANDVGEELFESARRFVRWHYQWVVVNDFLRAMVGQPLLADIFGNGRRLYRPEHCKFNAHFGGEPFIPVEFSAAAYRFGHSMIPQRIQVQSGKAAVDVFGPTLGSGFKPIENSKAVVEWPQLLDLADASVDRADTLDLQMAADLLDLPFVDAGEKSLATRNLLRGQAFRLPSGEYIAKLCERPGDEIATVANLAQSVAAQSSPPAQLAAGTPLWLYLLAEAAAIGQETTPGNFEIGEGLGPVGGRLVAETIIGILDLDDSSYLGSNRNWSPEVEEHSIGVTSLLEMLSF